MHDNLLAQVFVYLAAAVVVVPLAKRLGLGSVLGYLIAGVVLGPYAMGLIGHEGEDVMHFAEFGVVMMLFLVGLELRPTLLWQLRRPILGLGGLQVLATAVAITGVALLVGQPVREGIALGMILAGSSTAIVMQSLGEKGWMQTPGGRAAFSVLLFQDIAVIPTMAIMPLLASAAPATAEGLAATRPGWQQALLIVGAVVLIVASGRFLVRPLFRFLATTRLREVFTAASLALVIGITLLMQAVGLSPALGAFLAGVVLADSEYRHELEADIEPFKGLLLGVFFIAVGASLDFRTVLGQPGLVMGLVASIMLIKATVLWGLGRIFGLDRRGHWLLALSLAQVGEFAFVLFSVAAQLRVLPAPVIAPLIAVVALSMLVTPLVLMAYERVLLPRMNDEVAAPEREADEIVAKDGAVVIAGFGRFGQIVGRLLRASGVPTTVLDLDPEIVDVIRRVGLEVHYGDASRLDLLHAAGCARARLFVLAVDDHEKALDIGHTVRKHFPNLPILARARGRQEYYQMVQLQPLHIVRETMGSAVDLGEKALVALGMRAHEAHRFARAFVRHDEAAVKRLATLYGTDRKKFFEAARDALAETERLLREESSRKFQSPGWDNETLRTDAATRG